MSKATPVRTLALIALGAVTLGTEASDAAITTFKHPGILLDSDRLDFVREAVREQRSPWHQAYNAMMSDPLAARDYRPTPWTTVECGPFSNPDKGCKDEVRDAQAAYTQALAWSYSGDQRYAENAITIMNAWASTMKDGHRNSNAPLQASWSAQLWTRAAEIIRYRGEVWAASDIEQFSLMLRTQYLPDIQRGEAPRIGVCHYGNWQASGIEAQLNIAVFLDDRALFDKAISQWRKRLPAFVYQEADGPLPVIPPDCAKTDEQLIAYWEGQKTFVDGHAQETCRDLEHTAYGLAAFINVAETAYLQGVDLYGEQSKRLRDGMEFHAAARNQATTPSWLCGGKLIGDLNGTFEVAYNHYVNRRSFELPETRRWLLQRRPAKGYFHYLWETLTHADTGA
ncbi:alginate lyase family protein [Pseudomonas abietaniphila]|uniref:alginate lyase family protein n=1 Tax=Pseudomonas abietaniphila TaxID=89065 RepID=UPI00078437B9|nr:alginate lyase family protein [Pseudomonas abietaniphila]